MENELDIRIVDTTLRDGEQAPGVTFSHQDKLEIAEKLAECGVNEIEAGIPAMGPGEQAVIRDLVDLNLGCDITAWCRARVDDLEKAFACGTDCVHISFPASSVHLSVLGWSYAKLFETMEMLIPMAVSQFRFVSIGIQDAARTPHGMLMKLANTAYGFCVDRVRLADSVGIWMPDDVKQTVQEMYMMFPGMQIGVHTHNDLGMATANAVTAVLSGARSVDTTVTGIGERSGNAAMEQVVMALKLGSKLHTSIQTEYLYELCSMVAEKSGRTIPTDKPVIGSDVFRHETGIHVHAQVLQRSAYEAYDPSLVGRGGDIDVVVGKHSGTAAIKYVLNRMGVTITQRMAEKLLPRIRRMAERKHCSLDPKELLQLYEAAMHRRKLDAGSPVVP